MNDLQDNALIEDAVFRKVADLSPAPIFITDNHGVIQYVNKGFCEVSGYSSDEALGKLPSLLKSGKHPESFYKNLWQTIISGKIWTGEICNKSKSGKLYWEKEIIAPVKGSKGTIEYFISIRIDDMDRRRAEMLQHVQQLSGGIAHEFAQPLQVLTIMSTLLENNPDRQDYIQMLNNSVERITKLVHSLKNITTLQNRSYLSEEILDIEASSGINNADTDGLQILVVDDEHELRDILVEGLRLEGYHSTGVESGERAIDALDKQFFDIVVSDINMPGMDGIELFKQLRSDGYSGHFIFMTGYGVDDKMKEIIDQTDGIIIKPFQLTDLISQIENLPVTK